MANTARPPLTDRRTVAGTAAEVVARLTALSDVGPTPAGTLRALPPPTRPDRRPGPGGPRRPVGDRWHLYGRPRDPLYHLARSADPWRRRTTITATYHFLQRGQADDASAIAELLATDAHDLVHEAVGGWLREAGKHASARLCTFLDAHAAGMPRTALRFAGEHLDPDTRRRHRALTAESGTGATDAQRSDRSPRWT